MSGDLKKRLICAIYTRKSSEEGLEQEFNSLDAQREACEAYVKSQRHEGWTISEKHYDDGGYSGGNMERPGLVQLLTDIRDRKIDIVVVYKVDRLTRALSDFAKIVETFDGHKVSFVSVTQQFNTTTSMGRLTLNVLLSFAQFEREVTGERIRDKIAASRRKGMWMGGNIPFGYDLKDHKLIVNVSEAEIVEEIFRLYVKLKCVRKLLAEAMKRGYVTKCRTSETGRSVGGKPFSRGHLYYLLKNRVYLGEAVHRGVSNPGLHKPIISQSLWTETQSVFEGNRVDRKRGVGTANRSALAGIIFDDAGNRLTPTHTGKKGARYRYYVSQIAQEGEGTQKPAMRIPAHEIETFVQRQIIEWLGKPLEVAHALYGDPCDPRTKQKVVSATIRLRNRLSSDHAGLGLLSTSEKVVVGAEFVEVVLDVKVVRDALGKFEELNICEDRPALTIRAPMRIQKSGRPGKLLISEFNLNGEPESRINESMVRLLGRAQKWDRELRSGKSITTIANDETVHRTYVGQVLPLAFLAPDIVEAIIAGRQPPELKVEHLLKPLSIDWRQQRQALGFATP